MSTIYYSRSWLDDSRVGTSFSADKLGDPLPRAEGRVTLDPRSHIDLVGTIILPMIMIFFNPGFAVFGWGKPVRVSLSKRKSDKR